MTISREEHVTAYGQDRPRHETWDESAKIDLFGKEYLLTITIYGGRLESHKVTKGQVDVTPWLSDEEELAVTNYINEYWPEVQKS